jgi:secondary thiamine-phosphate synthase enzyme
VGEGNIPSSERARLASNATGLFGANPEIARMRQAQNLFRVDTQGSGFYELTRPVASWARAQNMSSGLLTLFCKHTSASLIIQENADPSVLRDLEAAFERLAPQGAGLYEHDTEGDDDMPAHIRMALTQSHLSIPLVGGELALGIWQGVFLFEHRARPHRREVVAHLMGE